jgi:MFS family permease
MTETVPTSAAEPRRSALRRPRFLRYLSGYTVDMIGDQVWFIALSWAAARAGDAKTAAMVVAAGTVPRMLLLLPAGVIVDRVGALRVAQVAQVLRIVTMLGAVFVGITRERDVALLAVLALLFGIGDSARLPAANAMPPFLLPADELPAGQGLVGTAGRLTSVLAGPAAGAALAIGGFAAAAGLNLALCVAGFLAFLTLGRLSARGDRDGRPDKVTLRAGLRYVVAHRGVGLMLLVLTAQNLVLAGPLNLGVVLRSQEEGWGPQSLGMLFGVFGGTAAVGALSLVTFRPRRHPALFGLGWSVVSALALAALGYAPNLVSAVFAIGVMGLALGPGSALLFGLIQANTSQQFLGRVMSMTTFAAFGLTPLALIGFGILAQGVGTSASFGIAVACAICCCLAGAAAPSLRGLSLPVRNSGPQGAA